MLDHLYANNYKSFVNFKVEFSSLNLMLGKNGSGKSNVFRLIFGLLEIIRGSNKALETHFSPLTLTRWTKSRIQTFELKLSDSEHSYFYSIEIEQNTDEFKSSIISEKIVCDNSILYQMDEIKAVLYDDNSNGTLVLTDNNVSGVSFAPSDSKHSLLNKFKAAVYSVILCSSDPKAMVGIVEKEELGARVNFSNIASIYAGLVQTDTDIYGDLINVMREINPSLRKLRIAMNSYGRRLKVDYEHNDVTCSYDLEELSDGEKMIFALYLLIYGYIKSGYTVLLDEPDNFLSLREILPWCNELQDAIAESSSGQCIMISHHPEIIDLFAAANGIWMNRIKSGESVIVDDLQKDRENRDLLKYSELISRGMLDETQW